MRPFIFTLSLIFAIACTSCSARKEGCPCSGLGTGSNPCGCDEIVVKAAKQSKPLHYVSPEAIAEAAVTREIFAKFSAKPAGPCGQPATSGINYVETASITEKPSLYEIIRKGAIVSPAAIESAVIVSGAETSGGCGCGTDLSKVQLVPKFPPIGDMCHTSPSSSSSAKLQQAVTKVTPAYPGKVKCSCNKEESIDCISALNSLMSGQGLARLTGGAASKAASAAQGYGILRPGSAAQGYGSIRPGSAATIALSELSNGYESISERYIAKQGPIGAFSGLASGASLGVFGETRAAGRTGGNAAGAGSAGSAANAGRVLLVAEEIDIPAYTTTLSSDGAAIVEVTETALEQQAIPQAPADPVSLSLAYKNLIPQQRKFMVSEDKLSFGPTAVPKEAVKEAAAQQIDEEKLVTIEKPVMQLQVLPASEKKSAKTSSEEEEERLAELDALERMRLEKESAVDCAPAPQSYVTYRELGYAPIVKEYASPAMMNIVTNVEEISGASTLPEAPCGPMGPPKPDYIPGNVYIDQSPAVETEVVEKTVYQSYGDEERSIESADDDDEEASALDDSQPGFLARLSSASRNYGASACPF